MNVITLDEALPTVRSLATRKAAAFVLRCGSGTDEREDIESRLVLLLISRWSKFDSDRASIQTFASRLMDAELTSILRYRLAQCRQQRELPPPHSEPTAASIHQFHIDLERAMAPLSKIVRETASALSWCSAVDAAGQLGCSRQMVIRRKHRIRDAFLAAGITPSYFVGVSARQ